jgi:DNA helicase HerA-like ATPase
MFEYLDDTTDEAASDAYAPAPRHRVGWVTAVTGCQLEGMVDAETLTSGGYDPSTGDRVPLQIGGLLTVPTPSTIVYGMVSSLRMCDLSSSQPVGGKAVMEIDLFGEAPLPAGPGDEPMFQKGVSVYPGLGAEIFAATEVDLIHVYARPRASNVRVGAIQQDRNVPAYVVTDDLLGKHFAILGTTGSGKSCAVTLLLRRILERHANGHIVLLDPHNEYARAFGDAAEVIEPDNLHLPYWLMNFEEISEFLVAPGSQDRDAEIAILKAAILDARRSYCAGQADVTGITVDTPVPYRMTELSRGIDEAMGKLDKPDKAAPYLRLRSKLENLSADQRFQFMFSGLSVQDNLDQIVSRILRVPVSGRPITVFDLSGVPSEIVDVVVSVMCRMILDFALWSVPPHSVPILLVCEEAHRYVPRDGDQAFAPTRRALSRIAKEGRKYGVSLGLVTQRPSELSATILSQCNTLFAMRMTNEHDREFVRAALPEHALGLMAALPSLRPQEAVVVGEGVPVPMRLRFDELDGTTRPQSHSASFSTAWQSDSGDCDLVRATIDRWRRQTRRASTASGAAAPNDVLTPPRLRLTR